jgi:hypothetical protein
LVNIIQNLRSNFLSLWEHVRLVAEEGVLWRVVNLIVSNVAYCLGSFIKPCGRVGTESALAEGVSSQDVPSVSTEHTLVSGV